MQCGMLLRGVDIKNEECSLDLATMSFHDLGGSCSIGQVRSEPPDVRELRINLEEESGGNGGNVIIFKKFGCVCNKKIEGAGYMELSFFFFLAF